MAKRNKFASKGRKSALRIEALEQRQLLAGITAGAGVEVLSNVVNPDGNTYDQVLLTGTSVTVTADPGQITRVSALDLNGDIVQFEFSGPGSMTVTLDANGYASKVQPAGYNQTVSGTVNGVAYEGYSQGRASVTIQGSEANTNVNIFSVGSLNAVNKALFDSTHTGGNNVADVSRLTIVANPSNPAGITNFGSIFAGNVLFSADSGTVGISAAGVAVQGIVRVGDIDAINSAVPTLRFGTNSQFGTLTVAGGDLASSNGQLINNAGFSAVNFTAGQTSGGANLNAQVVASAAVFTDVAAGSGVTINRTLDSSTNLTLTGKTQTELDAIFKGRTFTNNLTIDGLASGLKIEAASFAGLTATGNVAGNIVANSFGNLSFTNLSGVISTDVDGDNTVDAGEGAIGNVAISGNLTGGGQIESAKTIGNILVNGNVTGGNTAALGGFATGAFVAAGNIGTVTIKGDVNLGGAARNLLAIDKGVFGNVSIEGGGSLGNLNGTINLGAISINDVLDGVALGSYTAVETTADVDFGGINTDVDNDDVGTTTLGTVSVTVGGSNDAPHFGDLTVSGVIGDGTTAGNSTVIGAVNLTSSTGNVTLNANIAGGTANVGAVTISAGTNVTVSGDVTGAGIGAYSVTAGTAANTTGTITVSANKGIDATGNIASVSLSANGDISIDSSTGPNFVGGNIGAVTIGGTAKTGLISFVGDSTGDVAFLASGSGYNSIGNVTLNGRVFGSAAGGQYEFQGSSVGNVTIAAVTPAGTANDAAVENFGVLAASTRALANGTATAIANFAANANDTVNANGANMGSFKIGDVTVTQSYSNSSPNNVDVLFKGDNYFVATGSIGTLTVTGASANSQDTKLFQAATDSLVLAVGDTNGNLAGAAADDVAFTAGSSSVGNINITAAGTLTTVTGVGGADTNDATGFSGLTVLAGVRLNTGQTAGITDADANLATGDVPVAIGSGTYAGTVGNVLLKTYAGTIAVAQGVPVGLNNFTADAGDEHGGIFAKSSVGTLQGQAVSVNTLSSGVLIGPSGSNKLTEGNLLVYVL